MKKLLLILSSCLFIITGCLNQDSISFNRYTEEIKKISFDDIILVKDDFKYINNIIGKINFNGKMKEVGLDYSELIITTIENERHYFYIYPNDIIGYYRINNEKYYAEYNVDELYTLYEEIKTRYTDMSFYIVEFENIYNYIEKDNDIVFNLDDNNELEHIRAYKFISAEEIYNLKIHLIGYINGEYIETEEIYSNNIITKNNFILLKSSLENDISFIKIRFETKYGYIVEIISSYDDENNKIKFDETVKIKNN